MNSECSLYISTSLSEYSSKMVQCIFDFDWTARVEVSSTEGHSIFQCTAIGQSIGKVVNETERLV